MCHSADAYLISWRSVDEAHLRGENAAVQRKRQVILVLGAGWGRQPQSEKVVEALLQTHLIGYGGFLACQWQ